MDESKKIHYAWWILVSCIGFYALVVGVLANTAGIFLTPVMKEMGWSRTAASFYLTIFPLVAAALQPVVGVVFKKYNPRYILTLAVLVFGIAYMLTSKATTVTHWNLFGVVYGITAAFLMYIPTPWLINNWFKKNVGLALGIVVALISLFAAFASPYGNQLITAYGWRTARLIMGAFTTIIAVPITFFLVRKSPAEKGLLPYGAEADGATATVSVDTFSVSIGQAAKSPALYLIILLSGIFCMTASFFQQVPSYAATGGLGAAAGAMAVSIVMVGGIVGKFILGWLNDNVGIKVTGIISCLCGAVGILLAFMAGTNVGLFYVGLAIFGGGYAGLVIVTSLITRFTFGTTNFSQIYSWVTTSIFLFAAAAPLIYARIYDATKSFNYAFILVIVMYLIGAVLVPTILGIGKKLQANA